MFGLKFEGANAALGKTRCYQYDERVSSRMSAKGVCQGDDAWQVRRTSKESDPSPLGR